ncbi:MAG: hypothetical protein AAFX50_16805, partial [Acidobacteriota bacterium]
MDAGAVSSPPPDGARAWTPWLALALPCVVFLWAAFSADRAGWRSLAGGEGTALIQAESLRSDGDLAYERLDFERHVVTRYGSPPDLALVSGTDGRLITFDASAVFAVTGASGLALFGELGFIPLHALLLTAALAASAWLLRRRFADAPLRMAVLAFTGVAFAAAFRATPDVLIFAAVAVAAAL